MPYFWFDLGRDKGRWMGDWGMKGVQARKLKL